MLKRFVGPVVGLTMLATASGASASVRPEMTLPPQHVATAEQSVKSKDALLILWFLRGSASANHDAMIQTAGARRWLLWLLI